MKLKALVCLLGMYMFGAASCYAQMVYLPAEGNTPRLERTLTFGYLLHTLGVSICYDGGGVSWIRDGQSVLETLDTQAHERKHREQYQRFGSCDAFDDYVRTLKGRVLIEAEAYAAGLCAELQGDGKQKLPAAMRGSLERNFAERISYWITRGQVAPYNIVPIIRAYEQC